jgi:PTS system mannitol-specific IIC component
LIAAYFVKRAADRMTDEELDDAKAMVKELKGTGTKKNISRVIFACDAGMGSSAMGATTLRNKFKKARLNIEVVNYAIDEIPSDAEVVVTHEQLSSRAKSAAPKAEHISVKDFMDNNVFEILCNMIGEGGNVAEMVEVEDLEEQSVLRRRNIKLGLKSVDKYEAIRMAGRILNEGGYVDNDYIDAMIQREDDLTTYIGKGLAIPHGIGEAKNFIKKSGIAVLQFPDGVKFGDDTAYLVIGIAGVGDEHLTILSNIATAIDVEDDSIVELFRTTKDVEVIYNLFTVKSEE